MAVSINAIPSDLKKFFTRKVRFGCFWNQDSRADFDYNLITIMECLLMFLGVIKL